MNPPLALTGSDSEDAHEVMRAVVTEEVDPFRAVCAYAGRHGFTALMVSIPYWLTVGFGELGEESLEGNSLVSLGFRNWDSDEFRYASEDVDPAMLWAGRMAAAWCNGDRDNVKALMHTEVTPPLVLQYAHATLLGLTLNFSWTEQ